jgi:two-component system phosphate regulon sensor histidine kinase PhoR
MIRILVVDDDQYIRDGCARILAKQGWTASCAGDGAQALEEIQGNPNAYDAVLLDLLMPGMNGIEMLAQIRSLDPDLRVILMTGSVTADSANELVQKGAYDCIPKPFTPDELRAVVRKAVEDRAQHSK